MKHKLELRFLGEINNFRYPDYTTLMAESEEELKQLLYESERGERKSWLRTQHSKKEDHGIWCHHSMANRWGNNGNFSWTPKLLWMETAAMKLKDAYSLEEKL